MSLLRKFDSSGLLKRILAEPDLPERIRALKAQELVAIINEVGLEDCAEIVGCATLEQLQEVFDDDLWRASSPGGDEVFDAARFGTWLEVLLEMGSDKATEKIASMDFDFLVGALSHFVWVVEIEWLERQSSRDYRFEKVLDSTNYFEVEDFVIFSRQSDYWDAVTVIIMELDQHQHSLVRNLLERCANFTAEEIGDPDDLSAVLTSEEQLITDITAEREERRKAKGYVPAHEARAFLKLASGSLDIADNVSPRHLRVKGCELSHESSTFESNPAGLIPIDNRFSRVRTLLTSDEGLESIRMEQLVYLANVLMAGEGGKKGQHFRPGEAVKLALETCEKGLSLRPEFTSLLEAFRVGWAVRLVNLNK